MSGPVLPPPNITLTLEERLDERRVRFSHAPPHRYLHGLAAVAVAVAGLLVMAGAQAWPVPGLAAVALVLGAVLRWLARDRSVSVRFTASHLRWQVGNEGEQAVLLEEVVQPRAMASILLVRRRSGPDIVLLRGLDPVLAEWLAARIGQEVARRHAQLAAAGHDLAAGGLPPEARALQQFQALRP